MKRNFFHGLLVVLFVLGVLLTPRYAEAVQVDNYTQLQDAFNQLEQAWISSMPTPGMLTINGSQIEFYEPGPGQLTIYDVTKGVFIYQGADNDAAALEALRKYFGITLTSAGSVALPESAAATTSRLVFEELVVPTTAPQSAQKRAEQQKQAGGVRVFGGKIAVDWVDIKDGGDEGNIYSFSLGLAQDFDHVSVGVILPYDRLDFDEYEADRFGAIVFGQYHIDVTEALRASLTANVNYMNTNYDFDDGLNFLNDPDHAGDDGDNEHINTYGGGLSAGLRYMQERYELGCGVSWQYNEDDLKLKDDHQNLLKVGANVGLHVTPEQVVNLFGVWNKDVTDYHADLGDDDYFDLGVEYRADIANSWTVSGGYKKIVGLDDYDSDLVYIGSAWTF